MNTKLSLSLDKELIAEAKKYARKKNTSLSGIIKNYLVSVTRNSKKDNLEISPVVKSLSGVLKMDKTTDHKKEYADFLTSKYK